MSRTNIDIKDIILSELIVSYNSSLSTRNITAYKYVANLLGVDESFMKNTAFGDLVNTKDTIAQKLFKLSFIGEPSTIPKKLNDSSSNLHKMVMSINNKNEYSLYSRAFSGRELMGIQLSISHGTGA